MKELSGEEAIGLVLEWAYQNAKPDDVLSAKAYWYFLNGGLNER